MVCHAERSEASALGVRIPRRRFGMTTALAVAAASLALAGCGAPATVAPAQAQTANTQAIPAQAPATARPTAVATNAIDIKGFDFHPAVITVPVGTTVTWTNDDVEQHTVTARDKSFNSDAINNGQTFSFTFSQAGSYDYFCQIHPHMTGTVVVAGK